MSKNRLRDLVDEFDTVYLTKEDDSEGQDTATGTELSDGVRTLRSGSHHHRVSVDLSHPTNPTLTHPSMSTTPPPTPAPAASATAAAARTPAINVLPAPVTVTAFSGTDPNYSARDFLEQCENVMANSFVSDPADKIAFVRSRLQTGSQAHFQMSASAFTTPMEEKDYALFKIRFLEVFSDFTQKGVVKGVNSICERLAGLVFSHDTLDAQVHANKIAKNLKLLLTQNGWITNGSISVESVRNFLEFYTYMLTLKNTQRKSALALDFKPTDCLHDFCQRLKIKMEESPISARNSAATVAIT